MTDRVDVIKRVIAEAEYHGKEITIHKQPVRLVSGKMKMMYPAKSGSSKGGK